jgi:hypothetical protein
MDLRQNERGGGDSTALLGSSTKEKRGFIRRRLTASSVKRLISLRTMMLKAISGWSRSALLSFLFLYLFSSCC